MDEANKCRQMRDLPSGVHSDDELQSVVSKKQQRCAEVSMHIAEVECN